MKTALTAAMFLLATVLAGPAAADVPRNVHDGRAGVVDGGWVRVLCASSGDGAKCALRVPGGYSRMNLDIYRGAELLYTEKSWPYPTPRRITAPGRIVRGEVAPGVRVRCGGVGNVVSCRFRLARRISDVNVTLYSAGSNQGGPTGKGF